MNSKKKYKFDIEIHKHSMLSNGKNITSDPMTIKQLEAYLKREAKEILENSENLEYVYYVAWEQNSEKKIDELLMCFVIGRKHSENIRIYSMVS
ncbi:MAG: hypothetical protein J1F35_03380 [Erysipelotrichales bacterium]|nr:hypothetical protein [Erysipelotrichales bacterium]